MPNDTTQQMYDHTSAACELVADRSLQRPAIERRKKLTEQQAEDAMVGARDLASDRDIDARLYWYRLMDLCRREYLAATRRPVTPIEDYLPDGEKRRELEYEAAMDENDGFDAEHLDVQPEDEEATHAD